MEYTQGNTFSDDFQKFLMDDSTSMTNPNGGVNNAHQNRNKQPKLSNITKNNT